MRTLELLIVTSFLSLSLSASSQGERPGARPLHVAVSPDGRTLLTTSAQSNAVRIVELDAQGAPLLAADRTPLHPPLDVGGRSAGAVFLDDATAVVSLPELEKLVLLHRGASGWHAGAQHTLLGTPRAVVRHPDVVNHPWHVLVTLSGRSLMPLDSPWAWMHLVQAVDLASSMTSGLYFTEREPRALAFSPDGQRMYVATVAGAQGQDSRWPTGMLPDEDVADSAEDGGSILAYDLVGGCYPVQRLALGSPVRGLLAWPPPGLWSPGGDYHLYATNVGEGAASESPRFGGRTIPNLVTDFTFTSGHAAVGRRDLFVNHAPGTEWTVGTAGQVVLGSGFPAVLPEGLAATGIVGGTGGRVAELWVSFSASGTVGRIGIDAQGALLGVPQALPNGFHVVHLAQRDADPILADTYGAGLPRIELAPPSLDVFTDPRKVTDPALVHVGRSQEGSTLALPGELALSASPRGLAYDAVFDQLWVVTHFDEELVCIGFEELADGSRLPRREHAVALTSAWLAPEAESRESHERRFATFGQGFDFRETRPVDPVAKVNNLACTTCHVENHGDGKVRLTERVVSNVPTQPPPPGSVQNGRTAKPVAVPSVFDTGASEWLFFEGLTTTHDDFETFGTCNYCNAQSFFLDTERFALDLASPPSPFARSGVLDPTQVRGKRLFEAMNCTRCHQGALGQFRRSNEDEEPALLQLGPLTTLGPARSERILNDRTQAFVTRLPRDEPFPDDNASFRNMTDVGTRLANDGHISGINTPSLAGAWDNAPYMHDGRYHTLLEVLQHTFVDGEGRAAPLLLHGVPDNAFDGQPLGTGTIPTIDPITAELHAFGTHQHAAPAGRLSVATNPVTGTSFLGSAQLSDLLAFLSALSSQTELCQGESVEIAGLLSSPVADFVVHPDGYAWIEGASWTTSVGIDCDWRLVESSTGVQLESGRTARGTSHAVTFADPPVPGHVRLEVTARMRTVCGHELRRSASF